MSHDREAGRLNFEYYRKAAKSLLKAAQSGNSSALERLARFRPGAGAPFVLHQAQLTIAREQGFASWPRFRAFLLESALDFQGVVARFIETALDDLQSAEELLARRPEIAGAGRSHGRESRKAYVKQRVPIARPSFRGDDGQRFRDRLFHWRHIAQHKRHKNSGPADFRSLRRHSSPPCKSADAVSVDLADTT